MSLATIVMLGQEESELVLPKIDWLVITPFLTLVVGAFLILVLSALVTQRFGAWVYGLFSIVSAVAAIGVAVPLWMRVQDIGRGPISTMGGSFSLDGFSVLLTVVIAVAVVLTSVVAIPYIDKEQLGGPEFFSLLLMSASGGLVMVGANDLMVMFLGLEIMSISVYVLAALNLRRFTSQEAGIKYFVLGSFASAFLLFGIAFAYGAVGSTNLVVIRQRLSETILVNDGLLQASMALMLVGFAFKIGAAPFHAWTPDVYDGAPSPVVTYMSSGVKAAAFAGLLRVFYLGLGSYADDWKPVIYVLAIITMLVGAVMAVTQTNIKRMLAYSSIGHAGFILIGVEAATERGVAAVLFYVSAYTVLAAGSFAIVSVVGGRGDGNHQISDYNGLAGNKPVLALCFSILLFSQAGVPFTAGFMAKFNVIGAAVDSRAFPLAVVAMLSAVISAFLYLRITVSMWMSDESSAHAESVTVPGLAWVVITVCVALTLVIGVFPDYFLDLVNQAVPVLVIS